MANQQKPRQVTPILVEVHPLAGTGKAIIPQTLDPQGKPLRADRAFGQGDKAYRVGLT